MKVVVFSKFSSKACLAVAYLFAMTAQVWAQDCPPNTVSLWKLDDATGIMATDSVGVNHGTLANGSVWTVGKVNGALRFDGLDDYISLPDSQSLKPSSAITLEAWIKPSRLDKDMHIISTAGPGPSLFGHDYFMRTADNGVLYFSINNNFFHVLNAIPLPNLWYHVVGTYDQSDGLQKIYVDGVLRGEQPYMSPINTGHNTVTIGDNARVPAFGHYLLSAFQGLIDEVAIYDRALTQDEVLQHYEFGLQGQGYCTPILICDGFLPPMSAGRVKVKKNRALPVKAQLFDSDGSLVTDAMISPPVIQVLFTASSSTESVDVTEDALAAGMGTEGNEFEFEIDKWQFNLKTNPYRAVGNYTISLVPGSGYVVSPTCEASFVVE